MDAVINKFAEVLRMHCAGKSTLADGLEGLTEISNHSPAYIAAIKKGIEAVYDEGVDGGFKEGVREAEARVSAIPHPLMKPFRDAIKQVTKGKGEERHGRGAASFYDQPWFALAKTHGRGFLLGQAAKKLDEAAHFTDAAAWRNELLGVLVYTGMALLHEELESTKEVVILGSVQCGKTAVGKPKFVDEVNFANVTPASKALREAQARMDSTFEEMAKVSYRSIRENIIGPSTLNEQVVYVNSCWAKAPTWANWIAQQDDGTWVAYDDYPTRQPNGYWQSASLWTLDIGKSEVLPAWRRAAHARPVIYAYMPELILRGTVSFEDAVGNLIHAFGVLKADAVGKSQERVLDPLKEVTTFGAACRALDSVRRLAQEKAPWAIWLAQDANSEWWAFDVKPTWHAPSGIWSQHSAIAKTEKIGETRLVGAFLTGPFSLEISPTEAANGKA